MAIRPARHQKPLYALPPDVNLSDFDFEPTWQEREWERYLRAKQEYEREWLMASIQRLAAVALEIDAEKRHAELVAEQDRVDAWWAGEREKELVAWRQRELAKLEKIGKEIQRDAVRLERKVLEERGVVRGRRR